MLSVAAARVASSIVLIMAGFGIGRVASPIVRVPVQPARAFELRTYTAPEGKLAELHARFRDHTMRVFEKHGMTSVGYWTPQDTILAKNTLIYIISHASREAAKSNWASFAADPEWQKISRESQVNGRIVSKVESVFLDATEYSPIR
jgi:hypothetical protein